MLSTQSLKLSIRKNDQVQVIAGREKGKSGKVMNVDSKNGVVTIEKVNLVKRHVKPSQKNPQGGIIEKEAPIQYSNVLLFCEKCSKGVRHGKKWVESKSGKKESASARKKVRYCKRCDANLDTA